MIIVHIDSHSNFIKQDFTIVHFYQVRGSMVLKIQKRITQIYIKTLLELKILLKLTRKSDVYLNIPHLNTK